MKTKLLAVLCSLGMGVFMACSSEENQLVKNSSELTEDEFASQVEFVGFSSATTRDNPTMPPYKKRKEYLVPELQEKAEVATADSDCAILNYSPKILLLLS